ncbi:MAG: hypothetical protein V3W18_10520 [candidate division Zixibacteria bacterium]
MKKKKKTKVRIPLPKKTEKIHEDKTRYSRKPKHKPQVNAENGAGDK